MQVPVVPRGAGTSQCGQTVGAGLVINYVRYMHNVICVNPLKRCTEVELWYPIDVSTSAQASLGGMAGNNSCGSRSIAYGNMVHNVLGATVLHADERLLELGPYATASGDARALGDYVKALSDQLKPELQAN